MLTRFVARPAPASPRRSCRRHRAGPHRSCSGNCSWCGRSASPASFTSITRSAAPYCFSSGWRTGVSSSSSSACIVVGAPARAQFRAGRGPGHAGGPGISRHAVEPGDDQHDRDQRRDPLLRALRPCDRAEIELQDEHARSEALLETVMPQSIAERLKSGREAAHRRPHRDAQRAVRRSRRLHRGGARSAARAGGRISRPAGARPRCARANGTGSRRSRPSATATWRPRASTGAAAAGAVAIGRLALAHARGDRAPAAARRRKLKLRIGIHCGPATAGVIGDTRFSYDVWGDAVNVASRMESHGEPGPHPGERGLSQPHPRRVRVRGARHDRHQGHRRDDDILSRTDCAHARAAPPSHRNKKGRPAGRPSDTPDRRRAYSPPAAASLRGCRLRPSAWPRGPRRSPGRRPSSTGAPCRARRSRAASPSPCRLP